MNTQVLPPLELHRLDPMSFATFVLMRRSQLGMEVKDLVKASHVGYKELRKIENGGGCTLMTALSIINALHCHCYVTSSTL